MLFNSYEFIFLFLPITLFFFYLLIHFNKIRVAVLWLCVASLYFYGYWNRHFLIIFVCSILVNYVASLCIHRLKPPNKKFCLWLGLLFNLGLLAYFKYTNFLLSNLSIIFPEKIDLPDIILPIGISFFTFTQIAYLVDCYRDQSHRYRFIDYVLFVTFFPHLVAGPILMHHATIPQFHKKQFGRPSYKKIYMAGLFFSMGLFKKVMIADNLAYYVNNLFDHVYHLSTIDAWAAALFFTFQIYFDFSAYSEMAVGLALLLNVRIPFNFNSPYKSLSIIEFWRRWHISLSRFLRDYLYITLGGNRGGESKRYLNLLTTMLLGGLWHGSSWTFVVWGGLHGCYLAINHAWRHLGWQLSRPIAWMFTFIAVMVGWVVFRASSLAEAMDIVKSMFGFNNVSQSQLSLIAFLTSGMSLVISALVLPNSQQLIYSRKIDERLTVLAVIFLVTAILSMGNSYYFYYFQF